MTRTCRDCKKVLPVSNFYLRPNSTPHSYCKPCSHKRTYKTAKSYQDKYRLNHPDWNRGKHLRSAYGMSVEEYDQLERLQNFVCAICKGPETRKLFGKIPKLAVDHDHVTGKVRGLLCARCNRTLGMFKDNTELFHAAISYLTAYQTQVEA